MVFAVSDKDGQHPRPLPDARRHVSSRSTWPSPRPATSPTTPTPASSSRSTRSRACRRGVAFTNRTFRYLALPHFPEGIDINPPGPFSILNDGGVTSSRRTGAPLPASAFQSVQGFDAFNPHTNFHDPYNMANQNGVVFFPGSAPLYKDTNGGGSESARRRAGRQRRRRPPGRRRDVRRRRSPTPPPRTVRRADQVKVRGVRLPFFKFNRNPHVPLNGPLFPVETFKHLPVAARRGRKAGSRRSGDAIAISLGVALVVLDPARRSCRAGEDPPPGCPVCFHRHHREGTPPPGKPRCIPHTDERAGFPRAFRAPRAERDAGRHRLLRRRGRPLRQGPARGREEGTWGWDETGGGTSVAARFWAGPRAASIRAAWVPIAPMGPSCPTSSMPPPPARSIAWAAEKGVDHE